MPLYWLTGKDYQQAIGQITHHRRDARRCDWPTDASVGRCALGAYGSPTPHTHPRSVSTGRGVSTERPSALIYGADCCGFRERECCGTGKLAEGDRILIR